MSETRPMHRRWVGSLMSLLLPGAGIFLAGDRRAGLRWFGWLTAMWLALIVVTPLPGIPGPPVFAGLTFCLLAAVCWMLVHSYRPVPKLALMGWIMFIALVFVVGAAELVLEHQLMRPFKMPTRSMETTIMPGDHLFAQTCAYWFSPPRRGDIVVFKTDDLQPANVRPGQFFVKRIAALPGERVEITNGRLLVNRQRIETPAILAGDDFTPTGNGLFNEADGFVVPAHSYFVIGDNATNSLDSRYFGAIPRRSIIGKATKIYWPLSRAGDLQ
jgi:signal peptidase I